MPTSVWRWLKGSGTPPRYRRAYVQLIGPRVEDTNLEHRLLLATIRRRDIRSYGRIPLAMHVRKTRIALLDHPEIFDR